MDFGGGLDLAAIASAAGLGGSTVAAIGAAIFFKGIIMRILTQIVVTAGLTFAGFLALLNWLGFEIVPKDTAQAAVSAPAAGGTFMPESMTTRTPPAEPGKKVYYVKSPFRG